MIRKAIHTNQVYSTGLKHCIFWMKLTAHSALAPTIHGDHTVQGKGKHYTLFQSVCDWEINSIDH